jgi:hypothetical protein
MSERLIISRSVAALSLPCIHAYSLSRAYTTPKVGLGYWQQACVTDEIQRALVLDAIAAFRSTVVRSDNAGAPLAFFTVCLILLKSRAPT